MKATIPKLVILKAVVPLVQLYVSDVDLTSGPGRATMLLLFWRGGGGGKGGGGVVFGTSSFIQTRHVGLDLYNAVSSPERCWRGPRSQEVG